MTKSLESAFLQNEKNHLKVLNDEIKVLLRGPQALYDQLYNKNASALKMQNSSNFKKMIILAHRLKLSLIFRLNTWSNYEGSFYFIWTDKRKNVAIVVIKTGIVIQRHIHNRHERLIFGLMFL